MPQKFSFRKCFRKCSLLYRKCKFGIVLSCLWCRGYGADLAWLVWIFLSCLSFILQPSISHCLFWNAYVFFFTIAQMLLLYRHCSAWRNLYVLLLAVILEKCNWEGRWDSSLSTYSFHHSHSRMCIVMVPLWCLRFLSWNFLSSFRYSSSPFVSLSFLPLKNFETFIKSSHSCPCHMWHVAERNCLHSCWASPTRCSPDAYTFSFAIPLLYELQSLIFVIDCGGRLSLL